MQNEISSILLLDRSVQK